MGREKLSKLYLSHQILDDVRPFVVFHPLLFLDQIHFRLRVNFSFDDNNHNFNATRYPVLHTYSNW
jgi:hypothetical protein